MNKFIQSNNKYYHSQNKMQTEIILYILQGLLGIKPKSIAYQLIKKVIHNQILKFNIWSEQQY